MDRRNILMLGTALDAPGGITAVVKVYAEGGLFARWPINYLATYRHANAANKLWMAMVAAVKLGTRLLRSRSALVHAHMAARGSFWRKGLLLALSMALGARTILHLHDGSFPDWYLRRSVLIRRIVRAVFTAVDRVVVLTPSMAAEVKGFAPKAHITTIPNPVPVPSSQAALMSPNVLFLGRLWEEKGVFDLVHAVARLKPTRPQLRLVCAGDGDLDGVRALARARGIEAALDTPGWVDGPAKTALLMDAAVLVLPSRFEGLPMGVLEAMAYGVPVVANTVGGLPDVLADGAGALVNVGDIDGLAAAIAALVDSRDERLTQGEKGRARVRERYAMERVLPQLEALYFELGATPTSPLDNSR